MGRSRYNDGMGPGDIEGMTPPKFSAHDPAFLAYMEEHGYVVIANVADAEQITKSHDAFWQFHEDLGDQGGQCEQVLRADPSTWGPAFLPHADTGIITGCGFGQSRFCWRLRTLPDVRTAFEKIWGTDDLITSYDGGNAFRPWEARPDWKTQGGW